VFLATLFNALLGNIFQQWTILCSRAKAFRLAAISHQAFILLTTVSRLFRNGSCSLVYNLGTARTENTAYNSTSTVAWCHYPRGPHRRYRPYVACSVVVTLLLLLWSDLVTVLSSIICRSIMIFVPFEATQITSVLSYRAVGNNIMANTRTCEVGMTVASFSIQFFMWCVVIDFRKICKFW
jgi:hypothetical protein